MRVLYGTNTGLVTILRYQNGRPAGILQQRDHLDERRFIDNKIEIAKLSEMSLRVYRARKSRSSIQMICRARCEARESGSSSGGKL